MVKIQTLEEIRANRKSQENHDSSGNGLPPIKRYGEKVPQTGTHCSNCEYLSDDRKHCGNENFIAWAGEDKPAGSNKIPGGDPDRYCSIWWHVDEKHEAETK